MAKIKTKLSKKTKGSSDWEIVDLPIAQEGKDVQVRMPNGEVRTINTASPLYAQMYKANQIQSAAGTQEDPIFLNEVTITPRKGFIDQYNERFAEENKGSLIGSLLSPITYTLGLPQQAMMYGLTGKSQLPSEALNIQNPLGAFAVNAVADPTNLLSVGLIDDVSKLRNIGKFNPFKIKPKAVSSSVDNVGRGLTQAPQPWQMQELPGLHLKSTMEGEAISRIVEPKTGLINTEQALAIIGKESGGADKVALIRQGLGDNIPQKMDYNDFRKTVQDQLIPLETRINPKGRS